MYQLLPTGPEIIQGAVVSNGDKTYNFRNITMRNRRFRAATYLKLIDLMKGAVRISVNESLLFVLLFRV
jgi:hypothetical protein